MGRNYTVLVVWGDFLVRCQIIKANEKSGSLAGMEAAVMVFVKVWNGKL